MNFIHKVVTQLGVLCLRDIHYGLLTYTTRASIRISLSDKMDGPQFIASIETAIKVLQSDLDGIPNHFLGINEAVTEFDSKYVL